MRMIVWSSDVCSSDLFDHRADLALRRHADQALGRDAAGLLGGGGEALLAQPVDRGLHVALGLTQRLLAVHHAGAGLLAQFLDLRGGDCSHCSSVLGSGRITLRPLFPDIALRPSRPARSPRFRHSPAAPRSEEHTSELQSLMRISY